MRVLSVSCNHCGAPLDLAEEVPFLTCGHCGSRLEIHRQGGGIYSQVLQEIDQRTRRIDENVEVIRRQNELEALDREWQARRAELVPRGKHGQEDTGGPTGHLLGSAIGVIVGIVWTVTATTMGAPIFFKLFGVVMIIGVLLTGLSNMDKATRYHQEKQRYWERRERLLRELKEQN